MNIQQILFWFLSALAVGSALMVITRKNPVYSVLFLIVCFFAISGHYILLNAQFLAIVNVIVYAGAIMVLFLFVLMLMNLNNETEPQRNKYLVFSGGIAGGSLMLMLIAALNTPTKQIPMDLSKGDIGIINHLGMVLFKEYVIPFEISSVLFLSAMVGAIVIGKRKKTRPAAAIPTQRDRLTTGETEEALVDPKLW